MKKYNLALLPVNKTDKLIGLAQKFSIMETKYQLGDRSLPHITLCQFYADEKEIDKVWDNVCYALDVNALELDLNSFSCITFDNSTFWVSLIPSETSQLHLMRNELDSVLRLKSTKAYDPHLTLISTLDKSYESKAASLIKEYQAISDKFILCLGECDEIGQFNSILKQAEQNNYSLTI